MKKIFIFACLFLLLIGSMYVFVHYQFYNDDNYQSIIIVKNEVSPNTIITDEDIIEVKVFKNSIFDNYAQNEDEVVGYYTDYYQHLYPNQMIEVSRIKSSQQMKDSIHHELLSKQTTFSIQTDLLKSGGNSFVKHQKVDLYGVVKPLQSDPIVDIVLSNVRIIAVLDRNGLEIINQESIPSVINIAVDEDYIGLLSKLQKMGSIELYAKNNYQEKSESTIVADSLILEYLNFNN